MESKFYYSIRLQSLSKPHNHDGNMTNNNNNKILEYNVNYLEHK